MIDNLSCVQGCFTSVYRQQAGPGTETNFELRPLELFTLQEHGLPIININIAIDSRLDQEHCKIHYFELR